MDILREDSAPRNFPEQAAELRRAVRPAAGAPRLHSPWWNGVGTFPRTLVVTGGAPSARLQAMAFRGPVRRPVRGNERRFFKSEKLLEPFGGQARVAGPGRSMSLAECAAPRV
ncbi:MAG: hypothetical protein WKF33_05350 [Thermoleophilaceae bacterium]